MNFNAPGNNWKSQRRPGEYRYTLARELYLLYVVHFVDVLRLLMLFMSVAAGTRMISSKSIFLNKSSSISCCYSMRWSGCCGAVARRRWDTSVADAADGKPHVILYRSLSSRNVSTTMTARTISSIQTEDLKSFSDVILCTALATLTYEKWLSPRGANRPDCHACFV